MMEMMKSVGATDLSPTRALWCCRIMARCIYGRIGGGEEKTVDGAEKLCWSWGFFYRGDSGVHVDALVRVVWLSRGLSVFARSIGVRFLFV